MSITVKNSNKFVGLTPVERFVSQDKPNKKGNWLVDVIVSSCMETTAHGIIPIMKREHIINRLFWAVCLLVSSGACAYMVALSIIAFFDYETVTKTEKIYLLSTDFPAVTFCNKNAYLTESSLKFISDLLIKNNQTDSTHANDFFNNLNGISLLGIKYLASVNALDYSLSDEVRHSFGYNMSDMLFTCVYDSQQCSVDDFYWYFNGVYGNCYTFNSGKFSNKTKTSIKKATKTGASNGLIVEMFLYEPINMTSLSTTTGLQLMIHNQSQELLYDQGFAIPTGTSTNVQINRKFSSRLEKPYSDCTQNIDENYPSDMVQYILQASQLYTQENCIYACYEFKVVDTCGCFDNSIVFPYEILIAQNIKPCLNVSQTGCIYQVFEDFFNSEIPQSCADKCPLECDAITYNLFTSSSLYPARVYSDSLMQNVWIREKYANDMSKLTFDDLKQRMVQISVFYGDLGYDNFDESIKTEVIDLISNIGGTMGLFLGISFLSFVEILDIFLQILFNKKPSNAVIP